MSDKKVLVIGGLILGVTAIILATQKSSAQQPPPQGDLTINLPDSMNGNVGEDYSKQLSIKEYVSGNGYLWDIIAGQLPDGIGLSTNGLITGIPTVAGNFTVTLKVEDNNGLIGTRAVNLTINPAVPLTIITASPLPSGQVGVNYPDTILDTNKNSIRTNWGVIAGVMPPGLTIFNDGWIKQFMNPPNTAGTYTFTIRAEAENGEVAEKEFTLVIAPSGGLIIYTVNTLDGTQGTAYPLSDPLVRLQVSGGNTPYFWNLIDGVLPGMNLQNSTGTVYGIPTTAGEFTITMQVTDSSNPPITNTKVFLVSIHPAPVYPAFVLSNETYIYQPSWQGSNWLTVKRNMTMTNNTNSPITHEFHLWKQDSSGQPIDFTTINTEPTWKQVITLQPGESQAVQFGPGSGSTVLSPSIGGVTWIQDESGHKGQVT